MALQSSYYPVDGRSRTYPQTKNIPTKQHAAVYSRLKGTNTWQILDADAWNLINNSVVLREPFSVTIYDQIEVRIADKSTELTDSISDISVVASIAPEVITAVGIKDEIVTLAGINTEIVSLYTDKITLDSLYADKAKLDSLYADKAKLDSLYADKATLDSLFADKIKLDSLYADKAKLNSLYADKATLDSLYADKATLDSIYADKIGLDAIYANLAEILLADDNASAAASSATAAQLRAWEAEAEYMTAASYATEPEDVFVKVWTSVGNGTFTSANTTAYSALHWEAKATAAGIPVPSFPTDEGLALVAHVAGNNWEKILGLPLETGNKGMNVTNHGVEGDSFWTPVVTNPNVIAADVVIDTGVSASVVEPTINDGVTITVPDGSTLVIL